MTELNINDADEHFDEVYDVVVVGSGAGAMTAAYVAANKGLSTVVVEKTMRLGGTSAYSGGACWLPGTQVQQRAGAADSTDSARKYLAALLDPGSSGRQEAFVKTAPAMVAMLERDPAIDFEWRPFPDYFDAPGRVPDGRSFVPVDLPHEALGDLLKLVRPPVERDRAALDHFGATLTGGRALIGRLLLAFSNSGTGTIRTGICIDKLISREGRVTGVQGSSAQGTVRIGARHGVVLAAGGFEHNQTQRSHHGVPGDAMWSMAPTGTNIGEPIEAAADVGAATDLMDQAWWCPGLAMPDGSASFTLGLRGGLLVDGLGRRYANESLPYDQMGRKMAQAAERLPSHLVFDSRFDGKIPAIALPGGRSQESLDAAVWVRADTLDELADRMGVPRAALTQTVARFNGFARTGVDADFHRGRDPYDLFFATGDGPNPALVLVSEPPFYAARMVLADLGTKGGLRTDIAARVLREDGCPVPGLYAAGNTAASMTGAVYPGPGIPIGTAMVAGYLAVQDMLGRT